MHKGIQVKIIYLMFVATLMLSGCNNKSEEQIVTRSGINPNDNYEYDSCIVNFDMNGGEGEVLSKVVEKGGKYGELPVPSLDDCEFTGWYTGKTDGEKINEDDVISKDAVDFTVYARYKSNPGQWKESEGKKQYEKADGKIVKNCWRYIEGFWYLFDDLGYVKSGWQDIEGKKYYFDSDGKMATGWRRFEGDWYYFIEYPNGQMATGWTEINGKWYYFSDEGIRENGWECIGDYWYYFDETGVMQTGWQDIREKTFYFDEENGYMYKGWSKIKGEIFYFNSRGELVRDEYISDRYVDGNGKFNPAK